MIRHLKPLLWPALVLLCTGCSHYQLGTEGKLTFATLHVAPVTMRTLIPQAEPILGTQLREEFIRDGRVRLENSSEDADATLRLTVRDYRRDVATVRPGDTGLARKFTVTLQADATLVDNRTGTMLFQDRPITVRRDLFTDGGQLQAEYQLLPHLAQELAARTAHAVLDTW